MTQAFCLLPTGPNYRRDSFLAGICASGLTLRTDAGDPNPGDVLIVWNRSSANNATAKRFEAMGARVLVVENGYFGKEWLGRKWFAMAWNHHSGAGRWPDKGAHRWESWRVALQPWRNTSGPLLILGQRGIGEPGIAAPHRWAESVRAQIGGRVRPHPGAGPGTVTLEHDMRKCSAVATWHSAGGVIALAAGIPVWYGFRDWIAADAARHLDQWGMQPKRNDDERLRTMHRISWAMWDSAEVESGQPFRELLCVS